MNFDIITCMPHFGLMMGSISIITEGSHLKCHVLKPFIQGHNCSWLTKTYYTFTNYAYFLHRKSTVKFLHDRLYLYNHWKYSFEMSYIVFWVRNNVTVWDPWLYHETCQNFTFLPLYLQNQVNFCIQSTLMYVLQ